MLNWKKVSLVAVILMLVLALLLGSCTPAGPSTADFNTLKSSVTKVQADLAALQSSVGSLPSSSSVTSSIASATKDLSSRITSLESSVSALSSLSSSTSSIQSTVTSLSAQLSAISKQISDLQSQVAAEASASTANATDIAALKKQVAALAMPTTTPSTTPVTPTLAPGVTVGIVGNVFTGKTVLNFDAFVQAGTATQSFTYTISNGTAKTLTSLSLALGLESLSAGSTGVQLPTGITVALASGNVAFVWTPQSTGLNYLLGWTSVTSSTGFLGQLNLFSQAPGSTSYTVTVTVTFTPTATVLTAPTINLIPMMQVVDYSPK